MYSIELKLVIVVFFAILFTINVFFFIPMEKPIQVDVFIYIFVSFVLFMTNLWALGIRDVIGIEMGVVDNWWMSLANSFWIIIVWFLILSLLMIFAERLRLMQEWDIKTRHILSTIATYLFPLIVFLIAGEPGAFLDDLLSNKLYYFIIYAASAIIPIAISIARNELD